MWHDCGVGRPCRYNNAKRDRKAWCCQVVVPLIFLLFSLLSLKFANVGAYDDTLVGLDALPSGQTLPYAADPSDAADAERFTRVAIVGVAPPPRHMLCKYRVQPLATRGRIFWC